MTTKSPWSSTVGAWAAEAERADEEEKEAALKDSVTTKQTKKTKMSLQEFTTSSSSEVLRLPTRPQERVGHERQNNIGGGFNNYGNYERSAGSGGRIEEDRRRGGVRVSDFDQMPSRADEVDNSFGAARPREEVLQGLVKPKPRVNPFGDAKPREVLLSEKGLDWRKIDLDLEHKRIHRPETDQEKNLKEEIENLKKDSLEKSDEEQASLRDEIIKKEKELELMIRQLDDKVRFGQKNNDRPGSGSGRFTGHPARISSQHVPTEEPRGPAEFMDRPRSRGTVESWPRQNDDRRRFSGGRDRGGFSGSRELDRNRW